jgi:hypothetical protein
MKIMSAILTSILAWIKSAFIKEPYKLSKQFQRDLKQLSKSNPDLSDDLKEFFNTFEEEKVKADRIQDCKGAFKLYMKRSGKNKSGSYRVVYFIRFAGQTWFLHIYAKNQKADLSHDDKRKLRDTISRIKRGEGG